jgi:hypothetical protein
VWSPDHMEPSVKYVPSGLKGESCRVIISEDLSSTSTGPVPEVVSPKARGVALVGSHFSTSEHTYKPRFDGGFFIYPLHPLL